MHDQTMNFLKGKQHSRQTPIWVSQEPVNKHFSFIFGNKILTSFDSGLLTGMILIDLQKAFDTINHDILLKKMSALRFSDCSINWFQSYLSNRSFRVNAQGKYSCVAKIDCGVPQGSIIGPLLFLLYVNDMKQAVDCDLFLNADGSCLVYQHKDVKKIERNLNKNFPDVCD